MRLAGGRFGRLDQFPELRVFLQGPILAAGQFVAVEKIAQLFFRVKNPVNQDAEVVPLEVHPVVTQPEAEHVVAVTVEPAKLVHLVAADVVRQPAEFAEYLQLQFLGQRAQLCRGGGSEDDLEGRHGKGRPWGKMAACTRIELVFPP